MKYLVRKNQTAYQIWAEDGRMFYKTAGYDFMPWKKSLSKHDKIVNNLEDFNGGKPIKRSKEDPSRWVAGDQIRVMELLGSAYTEKQLDAGVFLSHAVVMQNGEPVKVLCGRASLDSLCVDDAVAPEKLTCKVCQRKLKKGA